MMLLSVIVIGIVGGLSYFIYGVAQMYKINTWQNAIGKELPNKFKEMLPLKRDTKGWFYITGKVGTHKRDFILDTQARSMEGLSIFSHCMQVIGELTLEP